MSFFDDAMFTAKTVGKSVGKRTEEIIIISKKKLSAIEFENKLESLYEELGKLYFSVLNGQPETNNRHNEIVDEVKRVTIELEEIRIEISNLSKKKQ
ncbi:MAG: hypothetical protein WCN92_09075 [Eubacteriales bacterium]